jgi:hypothetical protein
VGISPIGGLIGFLRLCIVVLRNVFELLDDLLGISCIRLINLMMRYDSHCYDVCGLMSPWRV